MTKFHYSLWLSKIPYTYHIFLIHSSVVGHLGCFQILAIMNIMNSPAINMGVQVAL
jgi:hypothetical protein